MRTSLLLIFSALAAFAQPQDLRVLGTTSTQAVISYLPPSSADCTLAATHGGVAANDTNASLFAGSNSDASRKIEDTGRRVVVIGARKAEASGVKMYSRALPADTDITVTVTCGSAASVTARTARISGIAPDVLPFNAGAAGNFAVPDFDWSDPSKPVIDPQNGARIWSLDDLKHAAHQRSRAFASYVASGWTSGANLLSDSTSTTASIGATTAATVMLSVAGTEQVLGGFSPNAFSMPDAVDNAAFTLHDLAVRVHGSGASATAADRQVSICRSIDSGQTCWGDSIVVTLPQTTATTQTIPASFPSPGFVGWGGKPIPRQFLPKYGTASLATSTLTITSPPTNPYAAATFSQEWVAGTKIHIAGSSGFCTDSLCTIASVASPTVLTLVESGTLSNVRWESRAASIRANKVNATSTINLSLGYTVAANLNLSASEEDGCHPTIQPTSVDKAGSALPAPIDGYVCFVRSFLRGPQRMMWIAKDNPGDSRIISLLRVPTAIAGHSAGDLPSNSGESLNAARKAVFDTTSPAIMYTASATPNGTALFKLTYTCDYREMASYLMFSSGVIDSADNCYAWENISRASSLTSQIVALPGYNSTFWGATPTLQFQGVIQGKAVFTANPHGQDYAGWVFSFDLATSTLERSWNTLNTFPRVSFAGIHSAISADVLLMTIHSMDKNNSTATAGPFTRQISHVKKSGSWSTNTSLPFPYDSSYDRACPGDIDAYYIARGATGNNCFQFRIPSEPCSTVAPLSERTAYPCPSNAAHSWIGTPLEPGHTIFNAALGVDSETMMIVKREDPGTPADPSDDTFTALRNQWNEYGCMSSDPRSRLVCVGSNAQGTHANGWTLTGYPFAKDITWNPVTNEIVEIPGDRTRGHFDASAGPAGTHSFAATATDAGFNMIYLGQTGVPHSAYAAPAIDSYMAYLPAWAGAAPFSTSIQSYIAPPHGTCPIDPMGCRIGTDWRHLNSGLGLPPEYPALGIGTSRTVTNVTGNVFKATALTGTASKSTAPWLTIGSYVLGDMSSAATGNVITDANVGRFCIPRAVDECRTGSVVGEIYWVMAGTNTSEAQCWASSGTGRVPCAWSTGSLHGRVMQIRFGANDRNAIQQRSLGFSLTRPSMQYVYSKARPFAGRYVLSTAFNLEDNYTVPILIDPGVWSAASGNRTTFQGVTVKSGSGNNILVEFGYSEHGARDDYRCTSRAEKCVAKAAAIDEASPFLYAGEAGAYTAASSTVTIPALPGRVLYYRIQENGTWGPTQVLAIP